MATIEASPRQALAPNESIRNHAAFIWSVADLLRGDYKQSEYGKVVLPLTVIDKFEFGTQIDRLRKANVLYQVVGKFAEIDLHPDAVSNLEMGYLYEELIRRFSELSNETAGEHFTPREVIRLMVNLLFGDEADDVLTRPGLSRRSSTLPAAPAACCR